VPRLLGHFPLTISLCLRALTLHYAVHEFPEGGAPRSKHGAANGSQLAACVTGSLVRLFQRPFYAAEDPARLGGKMHHLFRWAAKWRMLPRFGVFGIPAVSRRNAKC
jgi:hypothetical protein